MCLHPFGRSLRRGNGAGGEDGAFVRDVPVDGGEFKKSAGGEECEGEVGDEVVIQRGVVGEQRVATSVWEGSANVLILEGVRAESAETIKRVGASVAVCAGNEFVILVLGFFDRADGSERLGLRCCGVEEGFVSSAIGGELEGDRSGAGAGTAEHNVIRIATELAAGEHGDGTQRTGLMYLADVLLYPL